MVLGLGILVVTIGHAVSVSSGKTTANSTSSSPSTTSTDAGAPASTAVASNWDYSEDKDALTGKTSKTACSTSTNEVHLTFPYSDSHVEMCVRKDPRFGSELFVRLQGKGQVLCTSFSGCRVPVRFDEAAPSKVSGVGPSDNSSETVFLKPAPALIAKVKRSKHVVVGLNMYQAGEQEIEWNTAGLNWQ